MPCCYAEASVVVIGIDCGNRTSCSMQRNKIDLVTLKGDTRVRGELCERMRSPKMNHRWLQFEARGLIMKLEIRLIRDSGFRLLEK